jgi:hypothetical protein
MMDPEMRHLEDELTRLRQLRDATLDILRHEGPSPEEKLLAIERAFAGERDEDAEAEETRDRERLS